MSWKKLLALVMAFMMIVAMVPMTAIAGESPEHISDISRIYGRNRFETALFIAEQMKHNFGVEKFDAIIIASGNDFADALAGSYLANVRRAPILLSWGKGGDYEWLDDNNIAYIQDNLAEGGTVYILGCTNAVPELYENSLADRNVCRLGGENRFETNLLILEEAGILPGEDILVCTATNFADSLSASATGLPILLVWNEGGKLFDNQKAFLSGLDDNSYCIIGGENAVSDALLTAVSEYGNVTRLAGKDRFDTSVLVAERYFGFNDSVVLAYAWNYPDGLCGGALAYSMGCPLILTMDCYEEAAAGYVNGLAVEHCAIVGGTGLIGEEAVSAIFGLSETGHDYETEAVEATAKTKGYLLHTCSKCEHSYRDNYIDFATQNKWKAAYLQFISERYEAEFMNQARYYLVYLDGDAIPELWIEYPFDTRGCDLLTYYNGKFYYWPCGNACLTYIEFDSMIYSESGHMGYYYDEIKSMNKGELTLLASGSREEYYDSDGNWIELYWWNGEPVSMNEYFEALSQYTDAPRGTEIDYHRYPYTYDEIKRYLCDGTWAGSYLKLIDEMYATGMMDPVYDNGITTTFTLTYLDDDSVPEIWVRVGFPSPVYLLTYTDGVASYFAFESCYYDYVAYERFSRNFAYLTYHEDSSERSICKLADGQVVVLGKGTTEITYSMDRPGEMVIRTWNGKEVDGEEFDRRMNEYFDVDTACEVDLDFGYTYEELYDNLIEYCGQCSKCGISINYQNNVLGNDDQVCRACYLKPLDPKFICDKCETDCSKAGGTIDGLCRFCYYEVTGQRIGTCAACGDFMVPVNDDWICETCDDEYSIIDYQYCVGCGCGAIPMNKKGQCYACANGLCEWCRGPLTDDHDCNDYPNIVCPNCGWGTFETGVGVDGVICPDCGSRII